MQSNVFSSCSSPINYLSISCIDNPFKSKDKRNLLPTYTFIGSIEQDNSDQQTQPPPLSLASDTILGNPNSVSLSYNQLSFSCRKVKKQACTQAMSEIRNWDSRNNKDTNELRLN